MNKKKVLTLHARDKFDKLNNDKVVNLSIGIQAQNFSELVNHTLSLFHDLFGNKNLKRESMN